MIDSTNKLNKSTGPHWQNASEWTEMSTKSDSINLLNLISIGIFVELSIKYSRIGRERKLN